MIKIFYVENNAIKFEQKFSYGTGIVVNDICKITSLEKSSVKKIRHFSILIRNYLHNKEPVRQYFYTVKYGSSIIMSKSLSKN